MIADTVISDDIWAEAPEEPQRAFLYIAQAAYERLKFLEANPDAQGPHAFADWRKQYVYEVATVAEQLGIDGLLHADTAVQSGGHMNQFDINLARVLTRIRASLRLELRTDSVTLTVQTKADIRDHLEELRNKVNNSNLSNELQASLHKKIDAVEAELDRSRSSLGPFWALAGAVAMAASVTVGTIADLPDALRVTNEIVELVHEDKVAEESDKQRITQPRLEDKRPLRITHQPDKEPDKPKNGKSSR